MEIVDAHQHVGTMAGIAGLDTATAGLEDEIRGRTRTMDEIGIAWAVIQPTQIHLRPEGIVDTRRVNDGVAALQKMAPSRFRIAVGTVDPMQGDAAVAEIERCIVKLGLSGISWHHRFQGIYIDSPLMMPLLAKVRDLQGFAVIHTVAGSKVEGAWRLVRMARKFPEIQFLALDAFHAMDEGDMALLFAETEKNILWDLGGPIAAWNMGWDAIERWIAEHGASRLTFSADYIGQGTQVVVGGKARSPLLDRINESSLPAADKEMLLGGNIRRVLGRYL